MNPAISNPIKITGRPIINNNAFAIPHVALHAKTMNLIDNISIPITNNVYASAFVLSFVVALIISSAHQLKKFCDLFIFTRNFLYFSHIYYFSLCTYSIVPSLSICICSSSIADL